MWQSHFGKKCLNVLLSLYLWITKNKAGMIRFIIFQLRATITITYCMLDSLQVKNLMLLHKDKLLKKIPMPQVFRTCLSPALIWASCTSLLTIFLFDQIWLGMEYPTVCRLVLSKSRLSKTNGTPCIFNKYAMHVLSNMFIEGQQTGQTTDRTTLRKSLTVYSKDVRRRKVPHTMSGYGLHSMRSGCKKNYTIYLLIE